MPHHVSTIYLECNSVRFVPWITHLLPEPVTNNMPTDPGQNGHTPKGHTKKRPQHFGLPKRPQPKGHTVLVKTATQGGSLPKRPHCIWSKRLHRKDHYQNGHTAFGQNGRPHGGGGRDHWTSLLPPHLSNGRNTNHYQNGHIIDSLPVVLPIDIENPYR